MSADLNTMTATTTPAMSSSAPPIAAGTTIINSLLAPGDTTWLTSGSSDIITVGLDKKLDWKGNYDTNIYHYSNVEHTVLHYAVLYCIVLYGVGFDQQIILLLYNYIIVYTRPWLPDSVGCILPGCWLTVPTVVRPCRIRHIRCFDLTNYKHDIEI